MAADVRFVKQFLSSSEATASAFSSLGWDVQHKMGEVVFWLEVDYGLMEEMPLDIVLQRPTGWYAQMYIPPVRPALRDLAGGVCAQIEAMAPLVAQLDPDGGVLVGMVGTDVQAQLPILWQAFGRPDVYEAILVLCGLSDAPDEEDWMYADDPDPDTMYADENWPDSRLYRTGYPTEEN